MQARRIRRYTMVITVLLGIGVFALFARLTLATTTNPIQDAISQMQHIHSYAFQGAIKQAAIPVASPTNIGRTDQTSQMYLEGQSNLQDETLSLRIWSNGGSVALPQSSIEAEVDQYGRTRIREGTTAWKEVDGFADVLAPRGDLLGYLRAAEDVQEIPAATESGEQITRYTFAIDNDRFADYMRERLESYLQAKGELPVGMQIAPPEQYRTMQGTGELWVNEQGLPVRQVLLLNMPDQDEQRQQIEITIDFSSFGEPMMHWGNLLGAFPLEPVLAISIIGLFATGLIALRTSRRMWNAMALIITGILITEPLLISLQQHSFFTAMTAEAAEQEQERDEQQRYSQIQQDLTQPATDPHQDPITQAASQIERAQHLQRAAVQPATLSPDEQAWLERYTQLDPNDPTDTDGDGLTDYVETTIGTLTDAIDTDNDGITDTLEVQGFSYNGQMWYTNPRIADSNGDRLADLAEWNDADGDSLPDDTDSDGTPDLFDDDNDGDAVPDYYDMSPWTHGAMLADAPAAYSENTPFELTINNLDPAHITMVDVQLRPTNPDHLWYASSVFDWPYDRQASIQDVDGTTFADIARAEGSVPSASDENGDMKVLPMLEITAPDTRHLPADTVLERYSIGTMALTDDPTGPQQIYVPLSLVSDAETSEHYAFTGRIPYQAAADWGDAHQVRMVWVVQALNDVCQHSRDNQCTVYSERNSTTVMHVYDADWHLTGINVREDRGTEMAMIYEDPAIDDDKHEDGPLWVLSSVLQDAFIAARDFDADNQLDIDLDEIERRFDHPSNDGVSEAERWGVPDAFRVETAAYTTLDNAIATTSITTTQRILTEQFTPHWSSTEPIVPLIMMARTEHYRTMNMDVIESRSDNPPDYVQASRGNLTFDMAPASVDVVPIDTLNALSWSAYCAPATASDPEWGACDADTYWDELESRYAATLAQDTADEDIARGHMLMIQLFYTVLRQGVQHVVQRDAEIVFSSVVTPKTDHQIEQSVASVLRGGKGGVQYVVGNLQDALDSGTSLFKAIGKMSIVTTTLNTSARLYSLFTNTMNSTLKSATLILGAFSMVLLMAALSFLLERFISGDPIVRYIVMTVTPALGGAAIAVVKFGYTAISLASSLTSISGLKASLTTVKNSDLASGIVGFVIEVILLTALLIYIAVASDVPFFSPQFNRLLGETFAAIFWAALILVMSLTPGGQIIPALIAVIDAILSAICELGVDALRKVPGLEGACFTINSAVQKWGGKLVHSFQPMIDTERPELTTLGALDLRLQDVQAGYIAGNHLEVNLPVTTTITHRDPPFYDWQVVLPYMLAGGALDTIDAAKGLPATMVGLDPDEHRVPGEEAFDAVLDGLRVLTLYTERDLRSSTFTYELSNQSEDLSIGRNQMNDEWEVEIDHLFIPIIDKIVGGEDLLKLVPGIFDSGAAMYRGQARSDHQPAEIVMEAGVNFTPPMYLLSGYAIPAYECWAFPTTAIAGPLSGGPPPICYKRTIDGSNATKLDMLVFDVLPATFDEFVQITGKSQNQYGMAWDDAMPGLRDADGDGLLSAGFSGIDPDDTTWDADGDRLADAKELELRQEGMPFNTRFQDTDADGLTDRQELLLLTNPASIDTDNDGLLDSEEVYHEIQTAAHPSGGAIGEWTGGWTLHITGTQELSLRVTSNPRSADSDADSMSDLTEKQLAEAGQVFHPEVYNTLPLATFVDAASVNGFVAPGQSVPYTTTVVAEPGILPTLTTSVLDIRSSPEVGLRELSAFDFATIPTTTLGTDLAMPTLAESTNIGITSTIRARLAPDGDEGWQWQTPVGDALNRTNVGLPKRGTDSVANRQDRQDSYLLSVLESDASTAFGDVNAYALSPADTFGPTEIENDAEIAPYDNTSSPITPAFLRGETGPTMARTRQDRTMTVWDQTANCTDWTFNQYEVINDGDSGTSGIEPTIFIERDGSRDTIQWWSTCGIDQSNGTVCPIDRTFTVCGSARVIYSENDSEADTQPEDSFTFESLENDGGWNINLSTDDQVGGNTGLSEIRLNFSIAKPVGGWRQVAGAIINSDTSTAIPQFRLSDAAGPEYQPAVASDGSEFVAVWEDRNSTDSLAITTNSSSIWVRHFDRNGSPQGAQQALTGAIERDDPLETSAPVMTDIDIVWAGDRYWVVWRTMNAKAPVDGYRIYARAVDANGSPLDDLQLIEGNARNDELGAPVIGYNPATDTTRIVYTAADRRLIVVQAGSDNNFDTRREIASEGFYPQATYHAPTRSWLMTWFNHNTLTYRLEDNSGTPLAEVANNPGTYEWPELSGANQERATASVSCPAPSSVPVFDLRFEELPGSTSFANISGSAYTATCSAGTCPQAGARGAPRAEQSDLALVFDGITSTLTLDHAEARDLSIAFWLKSEQRAGSAARWFDGMGLVGNDVEQADSDYGVSLGDGRVVFGVGSPRPDGSDQIIDTSVSISSTEMLADGEWHHIVATRDQESGTIKLYVDGILDTSASAAVTDLNTPTGLFVGATRPGQNHFQGEIDNLRIIPAALNDDMVQAIYNHTTQSFCLAAASIDRTVPFLRLPASYALPRGGIIEDTAGLTLTVDAAAPASAISSLEEGQYIQGATDGVRTLIIGGEAADSGAGIEQVAIQVNGQPAEQATGLETWSYALRIQEGAYTIESRATDRVGNQETAATADNTRTVIADAEPPQMTSALDATMTNNDPSLQRELRPRRARDGSWYVNLRGSITDPAIDAYPGSGIDPASVRVLLRGMDDTAQGNQWQPVTLDGDQWSVRYRFANPLRDPGGSYRLFMYAADMVGNASGDDLAPAAQQQAVMLNIPPADPAAPTVESSIEGATLSAGDTPNPVSIDGVISDTTQAAAGLQAMELSYISLAQVDAHAESIMLLRLDEPAEAVWFADDSLAGGSLHAVCPAAADCPVAGEAGRIDQAVRFTGSSPLQVEGSTNLAFADDDSFSIHTWVRPSAAGDLVNQHDGTTGYALRIGADGQARFVLDDTILSGGPDLRDDAWHQVVGVLDRSQNQARLYVDGLEVDSAAFDQALAATSLLWIGQDFTGWLDQVMLFARALPAEDIQALASAADLVWYPASLDQTGVGVTNSPWSSTVPDTLEGTYQINARIEGVAGGRNIASNIWRGAIDMRPPRTDIQATHTGLAYHDRSEDTTYYDITYTCTATDKNLDPASFVCPCNNTQQASRRYNDDPALKEYFPDTASLEEIQTACHVWETSSAPAAQVGACDIFGQCTESTTLAALQDQPVGASAPQAAFPIPAQPVALVISPTLNSTIGSAPDTALNVRVAAGAQQFLREITVQLDGETVHTTNFTEASQTTDQVLSVALENIEPGTHTLVAAATDWAGNSQSTTYPVEFTLDIDMPSLTLDTTVLTTTATYEQAIRRVQLGGQVRDTQDINLVTVQATNGLLEARIDGNEWSTGWTVPELSDGDTYSMIVQAVDAAGQTTTLTETITVDLLAPQQVTLQPGYLGPRGETIPLREEQTVATQENPTLVLEWNASSDGSGLQPYLAGWTTEPVPDLDALATTTSLRHEQTVDDRQTMYAHLILRDALGNARIQSFGPVYIDYLETPDVVTGLNYRGWLQSPCTLLAADTRVSSQHTDTSVRDATQRLSASWDTDTLRLTWSGANWDIAGDLFIYLDTQSGGSTRAYNPHPTDQSIVLPSESDQPMQADYLVWVEDHEQASLWHWEADAWTRASTLTLGTEYQLDASGQSAYTDLALPFDLIGGAASTPVGLVAFATEEDSLGLWATAPADNPITLGPTGHTTGTVTLTNQFTWDALESGICVNAGFDQTNITLDATGQPDAVVASFKGDNLFQLFDLTRINPYERREQARQRSLNVLDVLDASRTTATETISPGNTLSYEVVYTNQGSQLAQDVHLAVTAWGPATLIAPDSESVAVIPVGDLAPGDTASTTVRIQVASDPAPEAGNRVGISVHAVDDTESSQDWLIATHTLPSTETAEDVYFMYIPLALQ